MDDQQRAEEHRVSLLHALVEATGGNTQVFVDLQKFGPDALGLSAAATRATYEWLREAALIDDDGAGIERVRLTEAGVARVAEAVEHPDSPWPGMSPLSVTNFHIGHVGNLQHGPVGSLHQSAATGAATREKKNGLLFGISVEVIGGVIAGVVLLFVTALVTDWFGLASNDRETPPRAPSGAEGSTAASDGFIQCAQTKCLPLRITNTIEGGRDEGAYVRSSPYADGRRLSGVFYGTAIYGVCLVSDGFEAIPGERRWVKSPFKFVAGDIAPDGSFANPPGSRPSRTSTSYGWITADAVGPAESLALLPECRE